MEDDLYSDLFSSDLGEQISKLERENQCLTDYINQLENDIKKLCNEITSMKEVQVNLTRNISKLFDAAKNEIQRKDTMISGLRRELDDLLFRRSDSQQGTQSYKRSRHMDQSETEPDLKKLKPNVTAKSDVENRASETSHNSADRNIDDYKRQRHESGSERERNRTHSSKSRSGGSERGSHGSKNTREDCRSSTSSDRHDTGEDRGGTEKTDKLKSTRRSRSGNRKDRKYESRSRSSDKHSRRTVGGGDRTSSRRSRERPKSNDRHSKESSIEKKQRTDNIVKKEFTDAQKCSDKSESKTAEMKDHVTSENAEGCEKLKKVVEKTSDKQMNVESHCISIKKMLVKSSDEVILKNECIDTIEETYATNKHALKTIEQIPVFEPVVTDDVQPFVGKQMKEDCKPIITVGNMKLDPKQDNYIVTDAKSFAAVESPHVDVKQLNENLTEMKPVIDYHLIKIDPIEPPNCRKLMINDIDEKRNYIGGEIDSQNLKLEEPNCQKLLTNVKNETRNDGGEIDSQNFKLEKPNSPKLLANEINEDCRATQNGIAKIKGKELTLSEGTEINSSMEISSSCENSLTVTNDCNISPGILNLNPAAPKPRKPTRRRRCVIEIKE